jgi:hypothetical protein
MMGWREIMGVQAKAIYPQNPQKSDPERGSEDCESSEPRPVRPVATSGRAFINKKRPPPPRPRARAEDVAYQTRLVEWLNANPASSASDKCAECGGPEMPGAVVVPYGTSPHTWLHPVCWHEWHAARRAEAEIALATLGIKHNGN